MVGEHGLNLSAMLVVAEVAIVGLIPPVGFNAVVNRGQYRQSDGAVVMEPHMHHAVMDCVLLQPHCIPKTEAVCV